MCTPLMVFCEYSVYEQYNTYVIDDVNKTTTTHLVSSPKLNPFYDTRAVGNVLWGWGVLGGSLGVHEVHEYQHG